MFTLTFNPKHLTAVFSVHEDSVIRAEITTNTRGVIFTSDTQNVTALVMPMRTDNLSSARVEHYSAPAKAEAPKQESPTSETVNIAESFYKSVEQYIEAKPTADKDTFIKECVSPLLKPLTKVQKKQLYDTLTNKDNAEKDCTNKNIELVLIDHFIEAVPTV